MNDNVLQRVRVTKDNLDRRLQNGEILKFIIRIREVHFNSEVGEDTRAWLRLDDRVN